MMMLKFTAFYALCMDSELWGSRGRRTPCQCRAKPCLQTFPVPAKSGEGGRGERVCTACAAGLVALYYHVTIETRLSGLMAGFAFVERLAVCACGRRKELRWALPRPA